MLPQIGGVQVVGKVVDTGSGVSAVLRGRKVMALKELARIQPGDSVLVQGAAGGVGSLAVQIAKALGAGGRPRHSL